MWSDSSFNNRMTSWEASAASKQVFWTGRVCKAREQLCTAMAFCVGQHGNLDAHRPPLRRRRCAVGAGPSSGRPALSYQIFKALLQRETIVTRVVWNEH